MAAIILKVLSWAAGRGVKRDGGMLKVVPDSLYFTLTVELPDGRTAFMTGPGSVPFTSEDLLELVINPVEPERYISTTPTEVPGPFCSAACAMESELGLHHPDPDHQCVPQSPKDETSDEQ